MKLIWHYTTATHLARIELAGYLRPTPLQPMPGETPAVWFSENPEWEPTAAKQIYLSTGEFLGLSTREMLVEAMGLARIGVEDGPEYLRWEEYVLHTSWLYAEHLLWASVRMSKQINWKGAQGPKYWRAYLDGNVPATKFKVIEHWREGTWK